MLDDGRSHPTHDLGRLVAFVDRELDPADTRLAEGQVAGCADCARLVDDLRILAVADRALATPPRPRDFRLTEADAARARAGREELAAATARPDREMPASRPIAADHAAHDPLLIAASVDADLPHDQRRVVEDWLSTCRTCAGISGDLAAITAAHRAMPTPPRPRDLRLTEADAARLRRGRWRDLIGWIGGARDGVTRPLATGLTTLGLVGVLITGGPIVLSSAAGAGSAPTSLEAAGNKTGAEADPGDSNVFSGEDPGPEAAIASGARTDPPSSAQLAPVAADPSAGRSSDLAGVDAGSSVRPVQGIGDARGTDRLTLTPGDDGQRDADPSAGSTTTPSGLFLSLAAFVAGLVVFVLRRVTRPLRDA